LLSQNEKLYYVNGLKEFNNQFPQRWTDIIQSHVNIFNGQAHGGSGFLTWHRAYLYLIEEAIRQALPNDYPCWTAHYWDITYESAFGTQAEPWYVMTPDALLGGNGFGGCIGSPFSVNEYNTIGFGCARRNVCNPFTDLTCDFLIDDAGFFNFISSRPRYGQVNFCDSGPNANQLGGFRRDLEYDSSIHPSMHCNIGDQGTTLCNTESPLDPLFNLIHGFIDFMLSSWQRCHGYDNITPYSYFANCLIPPSDPAFTPNCVNTQFFVNEPAYCGQFFNSYIGGAMQFPVIENQNWLTLPPILGNGPTLRHVDLYLLDSMHVTYDIGEFDENIFQQMCGRSFASKWFLKLNQNRRRLKNTPSKRDSDYFKFEMNEFNRIFKGENGPKRSKKGKI